MSREPFDVVVLGSLHLDIMVQAPALPRLGETVAGSGWSFKCGGKGGNQAVMAARQGARTAMVGRIGDDDFGRRLLANLDAADVDTACVGVDAAAGSGMSVATLEAGGDYGAVIVSGSNLALGADDVAAAAQRLRPGGVLILQNEIPESVNAAAAVAARASGARVLLNAAPARPLAGALAEAVDVLVVNAIEAEMLGGGPVRDLGTAASAAAALAAGGRIVVVTAGGAGLAVAGGVEPFTLAAHRVTVSSTHGAGDAFVGALAAQLAAGADLYAACVWANAAAAVLVSAPENERAALGHGAVRALLDLVGSGALD